MRNSLTMANVKLSNTESDADLNTKAMKFILDGICRNTLQGTKPKFSQEEVEERLRVLGPEYVDLFIRNLFRRSD